MSDTQSPTFSADDFGIQEPSQAAPVPTPAACAVPAQAPDPAVPESQPLPDERHERMLSMRLQGTAQYICFQRVIDNQANKKTATSGASDIFNRPEVRIRMAWIVEQAKKSGTKSITNDELRRIMAVVARSGCPNERIAASKQLREWIREDTQAQDARSVADPALIASHLAGRERVAADWEDVERVEFLAMCIRALDDLLHTKPADWHEALALDRADAPPYPQAVDTTQDTHKGDITPACCPK